MKSKTQDHSNWSILHRITQKTKLSPLPTINWTTSNHGLKHSAAAGRSHALVALHPNTLPWHPLQILSTEPSAYRWKSKRAGEKGDHDYLNYRNEPRNARESAQMLQEQDLLSSQCRRQGKSRKARVFRRSPRSPSAGIRRGVALMIARSSRSWV